MEEKDSKDYICEDILYKLVLKQIQTFFSYLRQFERVFVKRQMALSATEQERELILKKKRIQECERRIDEIEFLLKKNFESYAHGILKKKDFRALTDRYENKRESQQDELERFAGEIENTEI